MDCASLRDDLVDVLYGEASPATRARVAEHTAACEACRAELDGLRGVRRDLQAWTLPAGLAAGPARAWSSAWRPALAWAASLLLAFGGGLVMAGAELSLAGGRLQVASGTEARVQKLLDAQEARHRAEIAAVQARAAMPSDEVLRHVERLVAESEQRTAAHVDTRLVAFAQRVDGQRREDMARVSAGLAVLEGQTNHDLAKATELMGYVLQAAHNESR